MKWIYSMIEDGSYDEFKKEYIKCVLTNKTSFKFGELTYVKSFARSVVKYVDDNELVKQYNNHLEDMAEHHYNMQGEIMRGK